MATRDDEDKEGVEEEEGEDKDDDKQSVLKLFFIGIDDKGNWTPNSLSPPAKTIRELQVLELWPALPQCEHFLPISSLQNINRSRINSEGD